jgi:arsenite methyltransferase
MLMQRGTQLMTTVPEAAPTPISGAATQGSEKSCCSAFYELDWVRHLADDIFHPGGEALTRKTVAALNLPPGASIADLGCGTGTTAILLASQSDLQVSAIDISASNIKRATARAESLSRPIRFLQSDVHQLPFLNQEFDAVLAECTFSLFPNQPKVLAEIRLVLRPGGYLAITDMAIGGQLPADIAKVLAPWTCLADAVDQDAYGETFRAAGFYIEEMSDESLGLTQMVSLLKRKLLLLTAGNLMANRPVSEFDPAVIRFWLDRFREEVDKGVIRYLRFQLRVQSQAQ